jgi:sugar-specific transcriptional regulator TrmB
MDKTILENLGLNKTESKIYLSALELGESLHKQLAEHAEIKRPTLYEILPKLYAKGLLTETVKGKRKYIIPEDPIKFLETKKLAVEELQKHIPYLQSLLLTAKSKPQLIFYEGVEGIKKIYIDHLLQKQPILEVVGIEKIHPKVAKYIKEHYIWERVRRKIYLKMLISGQTSAGVFKMKSDTSELREVKNIDGKTFPIPLGLNIYGDNVSIAVYRQDSEPVGLIIRSKEIATALRSLFEFIWHHTKTP